ncbi:hypothetical protein IAT38_005547 [Cryptococcus sp. DSM 104549]
MSLPAPLPTSGQSPRDPLPVDVALRIAHLLLEDRALATLASVHRCSRDYYFALSPLVYRRVDFRPSGSEALFHLGEGAPLPHPDGLDDEVAIAVSSNTFFSPERAPLRRHVALRQTRHLTIHSIPICFSSVAKYFSSAVTSYSPNHLLSSLRSVQLLPRACDEIRTFIPATYDRPRNPLFIESLVTTSRPQKLCIAYRVLPSGYWDDHRELTSVGQYQLVARLNRIVEDGWDSLNEFCVHDIVHQVLPSLRGCKNVYYFSSHCLGTRSPTSSPVFVPPGLAATGLPGPEWNFRSWQLGTSVKNLFPSGVDAAAVLDATSWVYVNHEGSVLTKPANDDDDDTGVGYKEVSRLIGDALKTGLPQDLLGREGVKREVIEQVLERMSYAAEGEACESCGRFGTNGALISSLADIS